MTSMLAMLGLASLLLLWVAGRVASALLTSEAQGWLPILGQRIVRRAAALLPEDSRARWLEEALADLAQYDDRRIAYVVYAIKFAISTRKLRRELVVASETESEKPEARQSNRRARLALVSMVATIRGRFGREPQAEGAAITARSRAGRVASSVGDFFGALVDALLMLAEALEFFWVPLAVLTSCVVSITGMFFLVGAIVAMAPVLQAGLGALVLVAFIVVAVRRW